MEPGTFATIASAELRSQQKRNVPKNRRPTKNQIPIFMHNQSHATATITRRSTSTISTRLLGALHVLVARAVAAVSCVLRALSWFMSQSMSCSQPSSPSYERASAHDPGPLRHMSSLAHWHHSPSQPPLASSRPTTLPDHSPSSPHTPRSHARALGPTGLTRLLTAQCAPSRYTCSTSSPSRRAAQGSRAPGGCRHYSGWR